VSPANTVSGNALASLALANLGGSACGNNSLGGQSFDSSCTGNGGWPEYWCSDFVKWVWENNGIDTSALNAAAGSFGLYGTNNGTFYNSPQSVGDAVLFDYDGNGSADHVAIVTAIEDDGTIETVSGDWDGDDGDEATFAGTSSVVLNSPSYDPTVGTQPAIMAMTISGFVEPVGGLGSGALRCAGLDDGDYCGQDDIGGDPNTLYQCASGTLSVLTVCANGCVVEPGTQNDQCN
jgi:hypothetical protein